MTIFRSLLATCLFGVLIVSQLVAQDDAAKSTFVLIKNVNIFDGVNDRLTPGSVLIENNLMKEVGANVQAPSDAVVIDGGGRTLIPGLIDAHVHLTIPEPVDALRNKVDWMYWGVVSGQEAENMLLRGFTTVRDAGWARDRISSRDRSRQDSRAPSLSVWPRDFANVRAWRTSQLHRAPSQHAGKHAFVL